MDYLIFGTSLSNIGLKSRKAEINSWLAVIDLGSRKNTIQPGVVIKNLRLQVKKCEFMRRGYRKAGDPC
jgi:hypothetical protein